MLKSAPLLLIALFATTGLAAAQEVNPDPGFCAQFYPNADCNTIDLQPSQPKKPPAPPPHKTAATKKKKHAAK